MVGNERSGSATNYGITLQELRELMDHKGPEAIERIKTQYTNAEGKSFEHNSNINLQLMSSNLFFVLICFAGLCDLLQTSPLQGKKFNLQNSFFFKKKIFKKMNVCISI